MDGLCVHETYSKASLITPSCISKILISHLYDSFAIPILLAAVPLEPQVTMTLCSVFRFWETKLLLKNNRKYLMYALYLSLDKKKKNKRCESQSLWLVIPRILLSDHHFEEVTQLITILRNEHSKSLLKAMPDLAVKRWKKWCHFERKRKLPLLSVVKYISDPSFHGYKQI